MSELISDNFFTKEDQSHINFAINLAKKNVGITASNPSVGCVLVKNNVIVSSGITAAGGVPHAETVAILKAKTNAAGATLYVTLEPCSHFGKTPPCVDLIIKSKISRVVIATVDPDLRVNGLGVKKLKEAGIQVVVGVLESQATKINSGFFIAKTLNRPLVTLKLATSLDGKIATKNGDSKWITSEKSRQYAHYLRAKNDAILVGANTIQKDDPMLNCRIAGLEQYSPKRIILSSKLNINLNSKIIKTAKQINTYIATNSLDVQKFIDAGINIIRFDDLENLLSKLCEVGINNLLIEGGSNVAAQFLEANLIDKLIFIQAPKIIGGDAIGGIGDLNIAEIAQSLNFKTVQTRQIGEDFLMELVRKERL